MKFALLVLLVSFIALSWGWTETHNGEPGCKTDEEMTKRNWRNNWDPTRYFVCATRGVPGIVAKCPGQEMFQPALLKCVSVDDWYFEDNVDPPSFPWPSA